SNRRNRLEFVAVRFRLSAAVGIVMVLTACATAPTGPAAASTVKVGAVFPLTGPQAPLAKQEFAGVQIARDLVNADGGVDGVPISLLTKDLTAQSDAQVRVDELKQQGAQSILGAYSSGLSMSVSAAAQARGLLDQVRTANPDILVLASYIADGVDFRRAMLKSGLHVGAFIGSTMAQCVPDFGALLGADAIGVFASDRPTHDFNPAALNDTGRAIYARFAAAYRREFGPDPTEESLAGFSAAWTLFHYVMPRAHDLGATGLAAAARSLDLPDGTLANGAGIKFATTADMVGQNTRAASVIWQWQGVRHSVTVYP